MLKETVVTDFLCNSTLAVHRNSSELSSLLLVIAGINVASSITATLANALILVAFHKESSINPPSKLFLRCLAISDICVGLVVQPVAVALLFASVNHRWNFCHVAGRLWFFFSTLMAGFSLATSLTISVDRLLALSLGIRYRQVVTIKRARLFAALSLLFSIGNCIAELLNPFAFLVYSAFIWALYLIASICCYARIYLVLRNHVQAQVIPQDQSSGISPLNLSRYKKTVSTALWVFAALMICYLPFGLVLIARTIVPETTGSVVVIKIFAITLVYLNSSLNPLLYCWKIRDVRHAVKEILRNLGFSKLFGD